MVINLNLLDEKSATQAIETVGELAEANNIEWALVGGLAMRFYGSSRLTQEVDIIASKTLPMISQSLLKQGGARYHIQTAERIVAVDWIIRSDEAKNFYQAALNDFVMIENVPIITPEWLVILKYIAGRFNDKEDSVFLLSRSNTVNRSKIKESVLKIGGTETWTVMKYGLQHLYNLADGKGEAENNGYVDS